MGKGHVKLYMCEVKCDENEETKNRSLRKSYGTRSVKDLHLFIYSIYLVKMVTKYVP